MTTLTIGNGTGFINVANVLARSGYERTWNRSLTGLFAPSSKSLSTRIDTALSYLISKGIVINDRLLVEDYLANNSGVLSHLYELPDKILSHMHTSAIELGIFSDPDSSDAPEIYFEMQTSESPEIVNNELNLLNRQWIFASGDEDLAKINLTLKFY